MNRTDNRETRRHDITEAVLRVMTRSGLHAVTMRAVAAEADVSLRLVQHYFETKQHLMHTTLNRLTEEMTQRLRTRLTGAHRPRDVMEAVLAEAVPTDERSRAFHLAYTSYAVLAVTDETLAAHPFLNAPDAMETFVTRQLTQARDDGDLAPGLDPRTEAVTLLATAAGLGVAVLAGQRTPQEATAILHSGLARLFPNPASPGEQGKTTAEEGGHK
ncbi:TetR family transcriptional regulator C-terminal domain-containing protein [Streptosporangium sp. NPDC020072]|uniref:TetR/AcrR family transcriptional regulator n=1 Tax=Streptosporangium sp. NPDC020072 TaxID=3154788 RepID=UPI0034463142